MTLDQHRDLRAIYRKQLRELLDKIKINAEYIQRLEEKEERELK